MTTPTSAPITTLKPKTEPTGFCVTGSAGPWRRLRDRPHHCVCLQARSAQSGDETGAEQLEEGLVGDHQVAVDAESRRRCGKCDEVDAAPVGLDAA
jgi:hypothetical protein